MRYLRSLKLQDINKTRLISINWEKKKLLWKESCATFSTVWLWLMCISHTFYGEKSFFVWEKFSQCVFLILDSKLVSGYRLSLTRNHNLINWRKFRIIICEEILNIWDVLRCKISTKPILVLLNDRWKSCCRKKIVPQAL